MRGEAVVPDVSDPAGRLEALLETGVGVLVATRSADLTPTITRGWGPAFDPTSRVLQVLVTAPPGSETLDDLTSTRCVAVTVSRPTTYEAMQARGDVLEVREPSPTELLRLEEHLASFEAEVRLLGFDPDAAKLFLGNLVSIRFEVAELFDQTPGAGAGRRYW